MSIFAVHYFYADQPDAVAEGRPAHREFLRSLAEKGDLLASGPLVVPPKDAGLLIVKAASAEAAATLLADDPFQKSSLVERMEITEWKPVIGAFADQLD